LGLFERVGKLAFAVGKLSAAAAMAMGVLWLVAAAVIMPAQWMLTAVFVLCILGMFVVLIA
jgi:hypothetical protein